MQKLNSLLILIVLLLSATLVGAQDVAVTVYNQGTALVQDRRVLTLDAGLNEVNFTDVASTIDRASVTFSSLTDSAGTFVLEQNYIYDLVDSEALLNRYLDESIEVTTDDGTTFRGMLLSGRNGEVILRNANGEVEVIRLQNARNIRFPQLPDGLITRPTLQWLISSSVAGEQEIELTYLASGMNWSADYNVLLAADNQSLNLNGWVTLNNNSGTTYNNAQLKLVAGDVNRVQPDVVALGQAEAQAFAPADEAGGVAQREFFEYQLYEVERAVTIKNNETKQIEFVTATDIGSNTFFVYDGSLPFYGYGGIITDQSYGVTGVTDVQNWLEFTTGESGGIGADLPAGRIRVYQEDIDGAGLLIGENFIDHTPQGEDVQIYLGNAFDLVGERTQTDFQIISRRVLRETYEIRLRNRKDDETVEIRIPERLIRWSNWEILSSSHPFEKLNAHTIEFRIDVSPGEEVVLNYTVQYSFPG